MLSLESLFGRPRNSINIKANNLGPKITALEPDLRCPGNLMLFRRRNALSRGAQIGRSHRANFDEDQMLTTTANQVDLPQCAAPVSFQNLPTIAGELRGGPGLPIASKVTPT